MNQDHPFHALAQRLAVSWRYKVECESGCLRLRVCNTLSCHETARNNTRNVAHAPPHSRLLLSLSLSAHHPTDQAALDASSFALLALRMHHADAKLLEQHASDAHRPWCADTVAAQ